VSADEKRATAAHLLQEATRLVGATVQEVVPPKALTHLLKAQRELLLAATSIIEHTMSRGATPTRTKRRAARKRPDPVDID
jgi:hypothetical protein